VIAAVMALKRRALCAASSSVVGFVGLGLAGARLGLVGLVGLEVADLAAAVDLGEVLERALVVGEARGRGEGDGEREAVR